MTPAKSELRYGFYFEYAFGIASFFFSAKFEKRFFARVYLFAGENKIGSAKCPGDDRQIPNLDKKVKNW